MAQGQTRRVRRPADEASPSRDLLHDKAREAMLDPERRLYGWKTLVQRDGASRVHVKRLADRLAKAKVLALDSEMSHWISKVSCWHPEMMERALRMARLPHDPLWIEIDEHARQRAYLDMLIGRGIAPQTVRRTGYLCEQMPDIAGNGIPIYRITSIHEALEEDRPALCAVQPFGYYVSPEPGAAQLLATPHDRYLNRAAERGAPPIIDENDQPVLDALGNTRPSPFGFAAMLWGHGWVRLHTPVSPVGHTAETWHKAIQKAEGGMQELERLSAIMERLNVQAGYHCPDMWAGLAEAMWRGVDIRGKEFDRQYVSDAFGDVSGDLHVIMTLIALINTNAKHLAVEEVAGGGAKSVMGRNLPYYGFSRIRLKIPALQLERRFVRDVKHSSGWTMPWHPVRGHWMYFNRTGNPNDARRPKWCLHGEYHTWKTDEEDADRHECQVCGYRRTWRTYPEGKGDSSKRFIHQEMVVERNEDIRPEDAIA